MTQYLWSQPQKHFSAFSPVDAWTDTDRQEGGRVGQGWRKITCDFFIGTETSVTCFKYKLNLSFTVSPS